MQNPVMAQFEQAKQLMLGAQRICIISHRNPDADAVGANLALREALEALGKKVDSACIDPIPENCEFLPKAETFLQEIVPANYDLFITVDCGAHKLVGFHETHPEIMDRTRVAMINIDHHPSNDNFGNVNIVMPETPSTCFILYLMFNSFAWTMTQTMATAMLHGLYYDTGSFMHSNVDAATLRVASRLKALGGDHEKVVKTQFHTTSLQRLRLWGRGLERAQLNSKEAVVTAVTERDYEETKTQFEDLSGLVNILSHAKEGKFCMLLTEDMRGNIKGSLRTQRDDINLSEIAGLFGGGGHTKAAGFTIQGSLHEKRAWEIR